MSQATGVRADVAISQTLANEAQLTSVQCRMSYGETGSDGMHLDTFMIFVWASS